MKRLFVLAAFLFGITNAVTAQTVISNETMAQDGKEVTVSFSLDTDNADIPVRRKEVIMPYIYNGKDTLYLDVVEVYGKGRYKRERQENALNGDRDWELGENQTLKKEGIYEYESKVPLKRWMEYANLGIKRKMVGCACEKDQSDETLAQGVPLFKAPIPAARRLPDYVIVDAARQWDFGQDELEIVFKVSNIEIDSSVFNNEVTFGKILSAVDKIYSNPDYKVDKIEVAGYASPEGGIRFNSWLAENRAKALIDYIIVNRPQYNLTADDFRVRNGEENWEGLKRVLLQSDMDMRDEVVAVIDSDLSPEEKKAQIKSMNKGKVWKDMLEKIYPHLRCSRYLAIYYDSTDDKAVDLVNESNQLIREGKYQDAYDKAITVSTDMRAFNTIGVALMMQGRFEEAMPWFEKALEGNCPSSQKNIDAIKAEYDYEAQQKKEIEEYLKKYE